MNTIIRWTQVVVILAAHAALCSAGETGIVACYAFDEGTGMALKDHSGNSHQGTIHHAKWVTSVRGGEFLVKAGAAYICKVGAHEQTIAVAATLSIRLELRGQTNVGSMPPGTAGTSSTMPTDKQAVCQGVPHGLR
jgi:hypothetical protein